MSLVEKEIKKIDPRYLLAPDIDPEFKESFINAPGHLHFPTRNHFAFLESVVGIDPRKEKSVVMSQGFEYFFTQSNLESKFVGGQYNRYIDTSERPLTDEEKKGLIQAASSLTGIAVEKISFDRAYSILYKEFANRNTYSIDRFINNDKNLRLIDILSSDKTADDTVISDMRGERIRKICKSILTEREYHILELRFALSGGKPKTLEEIGKMEGVTRERIRQIQVKALKKIRLHPFSRELENFLKE